MKQKIIVALFIGILILCGMYIYITKVESESVNEEKVPLASLDVDECVKVFTEMGFSIPEELNGNGLGIKELMEELEEDPDRTFAYGSVVLIELVKDVRSTVKRYYGQTLSSLDAEECMEFLNRHMGVKVSTSDAKDSQDYELEIKQYIEELEEDPDRIYTSDSTSVIPQDLVEEIRYAVKRYYGLVGKEQ